MSQHKVTIARILGMIVGVIIVLAAFLPWETWRFRYILGTAKTSPDPLPHIIATAGGLLLCFSFFAAHKKTLFKVIGTAGGLTSFFAACYRLIVHNPPQTSIQEWKNLGDKPAWGVNIGLWLTLLASLLGILLLWIIRIRTEKRDDKMVPNSPHAP